MDGCRAAGHDHGIYVEGADNARIVDNVFYANADWGIHLYPDAEGSYIAHNVIDGNGAGLIFAGEAAGGSTGSPTPRTTTSSSSISSATRPPATTSSHGGAARSAVGNLVRRNCVWNGRLGNIDLSEGGFTASETIVANPLYVNRSAFDFPPPARQPLHGPRAGLRSPPGSTRERGGGDVIYSRTLAGSSPALGSKTAAKGVAHNGELVALRLSDRRGSEGVNHSYSAPLRNRLRLIEAHDPCLR